MSKKKVKCPTCKGKGTKRGGGFMGPGKEKACPNCGGTGYVYEPK